MDADELSEEDRKRAKWKVIRARAAGACVILLLLNFFATFGLSEAFIADVEVDVAVEVVLLGLLVLAFILWFTAALLSSTAKYSLATLLIVYVYVAICIGAIVMLRGAGQAIGIMGILGLALLFALHRYALSQSRGGGSPKQ